MTRIHTQSDDYTHLTSCVCRASEKSAIFTMKPIEIIQLKELITEKIMEIENPYPKDTFSWDNDMIIELTVGRIHEHCFNIFENCRRKCLDSIKELDKI